MNFNDTEIVASIMKNSGWELVQSPEEATAVLLNTCSVRENAESRVIRRLKQYNNKFKKLNKRYIIGIIGCMAERFNEHLVELDNAVNVVIGPDEYRRMPQLLDQALNGYKAVAVELSTIETYDDIVPLRTEGISAWLSIMRGCNNFCSYCVVPYTRGRERSRPMKSLMEEARSLFEKGFREITLLGQNVNSYKDEETNATFDILISRIAEINPLLRVRFTTSHPRDMSDKLIDAIATYSNICKHIHLPVQSGSDRILKEMNRRYTVEHYLKIIDKIKSKISNVALTTDIIAGFPTETEADHLQTIELLEKVRFAGAFMFKYSPREGTLAYNFPDDVPEQVKIRRLNEIIDLQNKISRQLNQGEKGKTHEVLVESPSKKNPADWMGRTSTNKVVIFPNNEQKYKPGDYITVLIKKSTSATLFGEVI